MKGTLFLSGGGDAKQTKVLDSEFSNYIDGKKVMYIPIAMECDDIGFNTCNDWINSTLLAFEYKKKPTIDMILEAEDIKININKYDAIYIGGGNTFKLLYFLKENQIDTLLKDFLKNGGVIYGGSAGAIIMGSDIRTVEEENDNNYKHYKGFNLLDGYSIRCHYTEKDIAVIQERNKTYDLKTIALSEESGIKIEKGKSIQYHSEGIIIFE